MNQVTLLPIAVQMAKERERRRRAGDPMHNQCPKCGSPPIKVITCKRHGTFFWRCKTCKHKWR